jgi:hypothetical protein
MKGENSDANGSDLDKNNFLKPTFDTLTEDGRKAFETYHADLKSSSLTLRSDVAVDHPQGHHTDHHPTGRGNTWGTT